MTKPPAFQFYVKDWLTGTRLLSLAAKGAYIDLLAWSWDNGPLPLKVRDIARTIGAAAHEFARVWKQLAKHFLRTDHGYVNSRLELERRKQKSFRRLQASKGRASAKARLNRGSTDTPTGLVEPEANQPGSTEGQPSFALALSSSPSGDQDPDQEQSASRTSRVLSDRHAEQLANPDDNPRALLKLAHGMYDDVEAGSLKAAEASEELKARAARLGIRYDGDRTRKALESAMSQREHSRRLA